MVCAGFDNWRDRLAEPRRRGRASARPHNRLANRSARLGIFRSTLCAECNDRNALAGAYRRPCNPPARNSVSCSLRRGPPSAPFAPSAGWGDVFIGATALPLAWAVTRFGARVRPLVLLWNAVGVADLVAAVTLGPLSAPGPLQVFVGPPTSAIMTTLPWLLIPGFLVPCLMFPARRHLLSAGARRSLGRHASLAQRRRGEGRRLNLNFGFRS